MRIAKEGYPIIGSAALLGVVLCVVGWPLPGAALLVFAVLAAGFFRDPERSIPADGNVVVSPADGKVIEIEDDVQVPQFPGPVSRVSIFMSPLNVHVNRAPVRGTVRSVRYQPGKFHAAFSPKASPHNERNAIVMTDDDRNEPFLMVQIAGALARRIVCYVAPETHLERGARFGLIMFGSRVDLYLPRSVQVRVTSGDRLKAGESVVGVFT